ncbi:hypothetical protein KKA95_03805 [Patescibacteria group bacterium]|nr:hypothetical protein [Patescibacteria group bacterium]
MGISSQNESSGSLQQTPRKREIFGTSPSLDVYGAVNRIWNSGAAEDFLSIDEEGQLQMLRGEQDRVIVGDVRWNLSAMIQNGVAVNMPSPTSTPNFLYDSEVNRSVGEWREELKGTLTPQDYQRLAMTIMNDRCLPDVLPTSDIDQAILMAIQKYPGQALNLLNVQGLRDRVQYLKENLIPNWSDERQILYAMKANPQSEIVKILMEAGIDGLDCASGNEVAMAQMHGVDPKNIYHNLPKLPPEELEQIVKGGARYMTVDHMPALEHAFKLCEEMGEEAPEIAVRIAIRNDHAALPMMTKFGIPPEKYQLAKEMIEQIKARGLRAGICMHAGSQIDMPEIYKEAIATASEIASDAGGVTSFNIGGGLPIDYFGIISNSPDDFLRLINDAVDKNVTDDVLKRGEGKIIFEFGRFMVAPYAHWISPVHAIEERDGVTNVSFSGGAHNTFNGIKLHGWPLPPLKVISPDGEERVGDRSECVLSGESCNPIDKIETALPNDIESGDYLIGENAGAYTDSYGSIFNGFAPPNYLKYNV